MSSYITPYLPHMKIQKIKYKFKITYKKSNKIIPSRNNLPLAANSIMAWCRWSSRKWGVSCGYTRWWQNVDPGAENEGWAVGVGQYGNVEVHGDVTGDWNGSGRLDFDWNFSFWFQMKKLERLLKLWV